MSAAADLPLEELRFRLRGALTEPPLVARCSAAEDVVAVLAYARGHGLAVTVRGGGDSAPDRSHDDGLVIDLRGMRDVEVDPERGVARAGAGATRADVDRAVGARGLVVARDTPLAVQLVDPEGEIVRVTAAENPELVRGHSGGDVGVLIARELRLCGRGASRSASS